MNCEVGLNTINCEAPTGITGMTCRTRCYRCDGPCCKSCSALVVWHKKRIRMCADCLEDERENDYVSKRIVELLGLTGS